MRTVIDYSLCDGGEILLRSAGLCNLTEVVVRADDTKESIIQKVIIATILGTFQSTLTNFRYVRKVWQRNAEEERLLGVSLTGIMDNTLTGLKVDEYFLIQLRLIAIETNRQYAKFLGISPSVAITTVKPSGTVSQLTDTASGIHPRFAPYYLRSIRNSKADPLSTFLIASGVPYEEDVTNPLTLVFYFPQKAPDGAVCVKDVGAIEQLEHYLKYKQYYTEHNPSITVYYKPEEYLDVGAWVYKHFDDIGGISFLPYSDHIYAQAPYQPISKEEYEVRAAAMPTLNWSTFREVEDSTTGTQELACSSATGCEWNGAA